MSEHQEVPAEAVKKKRRYKRKAKGPILVIFDGKKHYGESVSLDQGFLVLAGEGRKTYFNLRLASRPVEVIGQTNGKSLGLPAPAPALSGGAAMMAQRSAEARNRQLESMMTLPPMTEE